MFLRNPRGCSLLVWMDPEAQMMPMALPPLIPIFPLYASSFSNRLSPRDRKSTHSSYRPVIALKLEKMKILPWSATKDRGKADWLSPEPITVSHSHWSPAFSWVSPNRTILIIVEWGRDDTQWLMAKEPQPQLYLKLWLQLGPTSHRH